MDDTFPNNRTNAAANGEGVSTANTSELSTQGTAGNQGTSTVADLGYKEDGKGPSGNTGGGDGSFKSDNAATGVDLDLENSTVGILPLKGTPYYRAPRSLEGVIKVGTQLGVANSNAAILDKLKQTDTAEICPFINQSFVGKPSGKAGENSKLESVGIYKTVDLISEGPIAGLCDSSGKLIPIIEGDAPSNENMLKGVYLNDVPVVNTHGGTINYQRIHSEIKYGSLNQGLLQNHKQKSLSFLRSSQTFNIKISLPGQTQAQTTDFMVVTNDSGVKTIGLSKQPVGVSKGLTSNSVTWYKGILYADDKAEIGDGTLADQPVTTEQGANDVSIFGIYNTDKDMVDRMKTVFQNQPVVFHHAITNDNVSDVEISLSVGSLFFRKMAPEAAQGPMNNTIVFLVKIGYEDSNRLMSDDGDTFYAVVPISGLCTSSYERSYTFPLPVPAQDRDRRISICLASEEPAPEAKAIGAVQRVGGVASLTEIIEAPLTFPHSALMANLIDARSFAQVPKRTYDMKLLKIKIPANYDSENREYSGNWTGQWAEYKQWSDNPAWVFYDMMTSRRYGLQKFGFGEDIVDKWNLYSIAKYCDELVETGYRPANVPLSFSIDPGGVRVSIVDTDGIEGSSKLIGDFPQGKIISLFKLKDKDGTAINRGYRRRIGPASYDEDPNNTGSYIFSFSIHKIINAEYIFQTYEGLRALWYDDNNQLIDKGDAKNALSAEVWIYNYLNKKTVENSKSDFIKNYTAGFSVGSTVTAGSVVLDSSLYKPVLEPRFSTNIYLDREQDAMNLLNDLAAVFRGMVYWNSGFVFISNDQFREPVMVFNNSSVKDGVFTYTGSSKSTRFTSVLVRYNDAHDSYKPKVEYVEDASSVRKYGYLEKKIIALGTTSQSQAYRLGKWFLFTNQLETDLIQFKAGIESTYLRPGDVIKIQDSLKNTKRYGGRIKAIDPSKYQLTLDKGVYENIVGQKLTLIVPTESRSVSSLNEEARSRVAVGDFTGVPQEEINETRATQIQQFTVESVSGSDANSGGAQNDVITVEAEEDFSRVTVGTIWSLQNTSAETNITEVAYRVLSVVEETAGEYGVTAMMYESSKFGAVDESRNLSPTQQSSSASTPDGPVIGAIDWSSSLEATKYDVVETDAVSVGNKVSEGNSGAAFSGAHLEESLKSIKVLIELRGVIYSLQSELNDLNYLKYAQEQGFSESDQTNKVSWQDAPKNGNILIDVSISDHIYWNFKIDNKGRLESQTVGSGAINGTSVYQSSAYRQQFDVGSDVTTSGKYSGKEHWQTSRHTKIYVFVPPGKIQLTVNARIQDYKGIVTDSSSQVVDIGK